MKPISNDEIGRVEQILLPNGQEFDDARRRVVRDIENSCHVVACPGSGKTTVLLAKLLILAERMPFENNQGICVLTHTNVAIDEIKKKAGTVGDKLFKYPNFFGTIQSFVDRYLAMPAYYQKFNKKIQFIDSDRAEDKVRSAYYTKLKTDYTAANSIYQHIKGKLPKSYPVGQKTIILNQIRLEFINNVVFDFQKDNIFYKTGLTSKKLLAKNEETDRYKFLHSIKYPVISEGFLYFEDAFSLGNWYMEEHKKPLRNTFSQRFKYVFIDEMQDTDVHQFNIIKGLLGDTDTIIQYFGDPNQAIFDSKVKNEKIWIEPSKGTKNRHDISDSKRYGDPIAQILNCLKVVPDIELRGNDNVKTLKPVLILFEKGDEKKVLEKYAEILEKQKEAWSTIREPIYKAIGWVGQRKDKENEKREKEGKELITTIPSYWNRFEKKSNQRKQVYEHLALYLRKPQEINNRKITDRVDKVYNAKVYYENIINVLLRCLEIVDKKDYEHSQNENKNQGRIYTKTSLLKKLDKIKQKHNLLSKIAIWSKEIHAGKDIASEVADYIRDEFSKIFGFEVTQALSEFLDKSTGSKNLYESNTKEKSYIYEHNNIQIEVGTVHSVKGETHTATLYMETFLNKKYEIQRIINLLCGDKTLACFEQEIESLEQEIKNLNGQRGYKTKEKSLSSLNNLYNEILMTLKIVHVGFSRPTHLLCFAVCKDRIDEANLVKLDCKTDANHYWEIEEI